MSTTLTPFIKWGQFKSSNKDQPDLLELQVADPEIFETAYSVNVRVHHKDNGQWVEKILPLKSHESKNAILLQEWDKNARKGNTKQNAYFKLRTWLDTTKNGRPIRRFKLDF